MKSFTKPRRRRAGLTLIELLIYLALTSFFLIKATGFTLNVIYGREKTQRQQNISENSRYALGRIAFEIRNADDVLNVSAGSFSLANSQDGDITIDLDSERVRAVRNAITTYFTNNQVNVSSLTFTDLSTSGSKNIFVELAVSDNEIQQVYETAAEIRKK